MDEHGRTPSTSPGTTRGADTPAQEADESLHAVHRAVDALRARLNTLPTDGEDPARGEALALARRLDELLAAHDGKVAVLRAAAEQAQRQASEAEALEQLAQQRARKSTALQRLDTDKAEFIAIVAHELRTPLTSIGGYLELFADGRFGDVPAEMVRPLGSIQRNATRLRRLVEEMLEVSRIDAGQVTLRPAPADLGEVVREVVVELSPLAKAKSQTIISEIQGPTALRGERDKLHRIVNNLLSNAIRQSPPSGKITVAVDQPPPEVMPGAWIRLRVRDASPTGMSDSDRRTMFAPFSSTEPARYHTSSGPDAAGLGLYIARGLIEAHGGLITIDSQPGVFSEFTVLLPAAPTLGGG